MSYDLAESEKQQFRKECFDSGISIFGFPNFDRCPDYQRVEYFLCAHKKCVG
jgi:hypothetical protein